MINKRLINILPESKKYVGYIVLFKWLALVSNIVCIFAIGDIINRIYSNKEITLIYLPLIIAVLAIRFLCNYFGTVMQTNASSGVKLNLRKQVYNKLFVLGSSYSKHAGTGEILQMTLEGIESLENYFSRFLPQIFYSVLAPVTLFFVLMFISPKTAIVLLICVPLIPMSIVIFIKIAKKVMKKYWGIYSNLGNTFLENLQGLTTAKLFSADDIKHEKLNKNAEDFRKITMKVLSMQLNSITIMDIIAYGGAALGSIIALFQFTSGNINIGQLVIILLISAEFFIPLRMLGSYFHIATTGVAAADKVFELLDIPESTKGDHKIEQINKIELKDLDFTYNEGFKLSNINIEIAKNEYIAIVGESGSGKSTVSKLMTKMLSPDSGSLLIDDTDIAHIDEASIFEKINLIGTDSYIFNMSIKDNLLLAKSDATDDEITTVLKKAALYDFVSSLPEGLNTQAGEGGILFSGGQRQRIALARTLLSDRDVMIFDEAASNIDSESEELIWKAINEIKDHKTVISISHRLANIKNADRIYVMKNGQIVEQGSHSELMNLQGEYQRMVQRQNELESYRGVR